MLHVLTLIILISIFKQRYIVLIKRLKGGIMQHNVMFLTFLSNFSK